MAEEAIAQLYDGKSGGRAPFKAEYVSSLVDSVMEAEIDQILKMKALQDQEPGVGPQDDVITNLVKALKEERRLNKFPLGMFDKQKYDPSKLKIGIVGGGIAGLYTAYILEFLGIDYDILEANPKRMGGRIYTHHFSDTEHDYYDIGAMRFPNSPIMARTFDLFRRLDMGAPDTTPTDRNVLIPYYLTGRNCPTRYNDVTAKLGQNEKPRTRNRNGTEHQADPDPVPHGDLDPFKVSTLNGGTVPATRVSHQVTSEILDDAYDRFRLKIKTAQEATEVARAGDAQYKEDVKEKRIDETSEESKARKKKIDEKLSEASQARKRAYEYLMRHDKYSLREYLINVEGYDPDTVHWLETIDSASGWYDMAFTENVFESLAFSYNDAGNKKEKEKNPCYWYCVNGGTSVMIDRIREYDSSKKRGVDPDKIYQGKIVTKITLEPPPQAGAPKPNDTVQRGVTVSWRDYANYDPNSTILLSGAETYSAVVNTTTLGALQKIDLTDMELPYGMKTAIRVLRYDTSTKVGIRFKKMWWKTADFDISLGGVAKTDLPIRVCVYPSYNIHDDPEFPGVLLASYTWGQDSERIASHVSTNSPENDKGLMELLFYNLARLHTVRRPDESTDAFKKRFEANQKTIASLYDKHHAYDWSKDEFSSGAFALFSPGQFSTLIPHLVRPASDGRFVIVGEHASANHAWIVGALDSAFRGLKQILTRFGLTEQIEKMVEEFGDVDELTQEQVAKQVILSTLTEEQMAQLRVGRPVKAVGTVEQT